MVAWDTMTPPLGEEILDVAVAQTEPDGMTDETREQEGPLAPLNYRKRNIT